MNFHGRTVLITGASGNLGRAVATHFAQAGAQLLLLDRHAHPEAGGAGRLAVTADLLDAEQVRAALAAGIARFGRIDIACHLAGGFRMGEAVHETTDANWDFLFDSNARSLLNLARAVVPHMLQHGAGKIVTVGASAGLRGAGQMGAYAAAKSGVIRLTEAMAAELRERNINVNCVLPTIIDTPDNRAAMPDADPARWVQPQALAEAIAFLASDAARAVHGAALPVSGLS